MKAHEALLRLPASCPKSRSPVHFVPAGHPRFRQAVSSSTIEVGELDGLFIDEGGTVAYPVVRGIPQLVAETDILRERSAADGQPIGLTSALEIESAIYDRMAEKCQQDFEQALRERFGPRLACHPRLSASEISSFPEPTALWIDTYTEADAQLRAYRHLAPLTGKEYLQFGGTGSHAVKALLAGARSAYLLTPSSREIELGIAIAARMGVKDRLIAVRGVGEEIPLQDASVDRAYGGGCLHHSDITRSLPEIVRILRPGGRAAFVDPVETALYRTWSRMAGRRRFCKEDEDGTVDYPLRPDSVRDILGEKNVRLTVHLSGGLLRYLLVFLNRALGIRLPVQIAQGGLSLESGLARALGLHSQLNLACYLLAKEG